MENQHNEILQTEENVEKLSDEELANLRNLRVALQLTESQRKISELDFKNYVLTLYLKYRLDGSDEIEESTGNLLRK